MQLRKVDFSERLNQPGQIFVRALAADVEDIWKTRFVLGALRTEDRADAVAYIDDSLDWESAPVGNLISTVVRNRKHTVRAPCSTPDNGSIVKKLVYRGHFGHLNLNQIMNCENKGSGANERGIKAWRKEYARPSNENLISEPERISR